MEVTQESSERQEALTPEGEVLLHYYPVRCGGSLRQACEPVPEKSIERFVWTFDYLCKKKDDRQINK